MDVAVQLKKKNMYIPV